MLVNIYGQTAAKEGRCSPAQYIATRSEIISGDLFKRHTSTSYVERQNLAMDAHAATHPPDEWLATGVTDGLWQISDSVNLLEAYEAAGNAKVYEGSLRTVAGILSVPRLATKPSG